MPARTKSDRASARGDADSTDLAAHAKVLSHVAYWREHTPVLEEKIIHTLVQEGELSEDAGDL